jgi:DNA-binding transcriptional ArsR family regulator
MNICSYTHIFAVEFMNPHQKHEKAAAILKTIAHPTRLAVIEQLEIHESLSVNELCEKTGCEQSLLSHHLTNMRIKGILAATKSGTYVMYSLKEVNILPVISCIKKCNCNL